MLDLGWRSRIFCLLLAVLCALAMVGCLGLSTAKISSSSNTGSSTASTAQLSALTSSINFGSVQLGKNQDKSLTVTNSGASTITISQATVSGPGFVLHGPALPLNLNGGQSNTFTVTFTPQIAGAASGSLTIVSNASNPTLTISLSGAGLSAGSLVTNPGSLDFGQVTTAATVKATAILTNSGATTITISQANVNGSPFHLNGLATPLTLIGGQNSTFEVTFSPQSAGTASGNIAIISDASNSTLNVPLAGSGVAPGFLGATPSSVSFGSVLAGSSNNRTVTLNNSGGATLTISTAAVTGSEFAVSGLTLPRTLGAGQSTSFTVTFSPVSAGALSGNINFTSTASNSVFSIPLTGTAVTAGTLSATASTMNFGNVAVGTSQTQSETLVNNGGSAVTISQVSVNASGFTLTGLSTPLTLSSGQSKGFTITFSPSSATASTGNLVITSNASNPSLTISLSGAGTSVAGQLTITPSSINFGTVVVGTSQSQSATLTASTAAVTVSSISGLGGSEFSLSGISLPLTIAAGGSVAFTEKFTPQSSGSTSANVTFASDAVNSTVTQALSGTGSAPVQHSVDLSWNASTSSVVGYNIYRGPQSGGPYAKVNSVLQASTNYTDSTVQGGQTYYYVVTAVDSSSTESAFSNQTQAVIPFP